MSLARILSDHQQTQSIVLRKSRTTGTSILSYLRCISRMNTYHSTVSVSPSCLVRVTAVDLLLPPPAAYSAPGSRLSLCDIIITGFVTTSVYPKLVSSRDHGSHGPHPLCRSPQTLPTTATRRERRERRRPLDHLPRWRRVDSLARRRSRQALDILACEKLR